MPFPIIWKMREYEKSYDPITETAPLIGDALDALRDQTGLETMAEPTVKNTAVAVIAIKRGPRVWRFNVVAKVWINKTTIALLEEQIRGRTGEWLFVTRYIAARQAGEFRAMLWLFWIRYRMLSSIRRICTKWGQVNSRSGFPVLRFWLYVYHFLLHLKGQTTKTSPEALNFHLLHTFYSDV